MSTNTEDAIAKIDKALDTVKALCDGREKWTMRVPAEPDRDPDLVISRALWAARELLVAQAGTVPTAEAGIDPFPPHDPSKPASAQGLFRKFDVRRVDGSDQPGGKHHGCRYFVLDMGHDAHAPAALRAYADSCAATHPELAADLRKEFPAPTAEAGGPMTDTELIARMRYTTPLLTDAPAPAPTGGDAWKPIADAPKGEMLLLAAEFDHPGDWRIKCGGFWEGKWEVFGASWTPTRWQHLPDAPTVRGEGKFAAIAAAKGGGA